MLAESIGVTICKELSKIINFAKNIEKITEETAFYGTNSSIIRCYISSHFGKNNLQKIHENLLELTGIKISYLSDEEYKEFDFYTSLLMIVEDVL